jgi:hypothetical protein
MANDSTSRRYDGEMELAVWIGLAFLVVSVLASATYLAVRGLSAWRTFRSFTRAVERAVDAVMTTAAEAEEHALGLGSGAARMNAAAARLQGSLERLAVLSAAAGDARASLSAFRGAVPRK